MTYIDFVIVGIVALSAVISVMRGFVKEAVSLITWVLAFWVSATFGGKLATLLPDAVSNPQLRVAISFVALFLATLLVGGLANFLLSAFVSRSGARASDSSSSHRPCHRRHPIPRRGSTPTRGR